MEPNELTVQGVHYCIIFHLPLGDDEGYTWESAHDRLRYDTLDGIEQTNHSAASVVSSRRR
jgi:hypothetical protein